MKKFLFAASMLAMASAAHAATLSDVSGSVMVNKGKGFVPAVGAIELNAGDKIMVGEGGFATLSYDKCAISLDKPTVHAVAKVAPCDAPVISPVADMVDPPVAAGLPLLPLLLIGGGAAGVIIVTQVLDEEDDPVTPEGPVVNQ